MKIGHAIGSFTDIVDAVHDMQRKPWISRNLDFNSTSAISEDRYLLLKNSFFGRGWLLF